MTLIRRSALALILPLAAAAATPTVPDLQGMDPQVRAQDDLYRAANGRWQAAAVIPSNKAEVYGAELPDLVSARVRALIDDLSARPQPDGSVEQKVALYYASFTDTAAIDRAGLAPLRASLERIAAIDSPSALARWQGQMQGVIQTPLWMWGGFADFQDPKLNRALVMQGGLGLPDRAYYLDTADARMAAARQAYQEYLATLAQLAGMAQPQQAAARVMAVEMRLARAHTPAAEAMNPAVVRAMRADQAGQAMPGFDWAAFYAGAQIGAGQALNLMQPDTAKAVAALMAELPLDDWKLYFSLRTIDEAAPVLPAAFRAAHFDFHGKALQGRSAPGARADLGVAQVGTAMGDALSHLYVERHFPASHKARATQMVGTLMAAARAAVDNMRWMDPATRAEAGRKIAALKAKVGHPDQWRDLGGLQILAGDALGNRQRAQRFEWARLAALSGTPVDRALWLMAPMEVNAYYDPMLNEINLPAGILQSPLFDMTADDAANYGGIGAVIAHEISHGFDATGAQFDSHGVLRDWWTAADHQAFDAMAARLVAQYDAYAPLPGKHVNGKLTLAENMADTMGLQIALDAYHLSLGGKSAPVIDGLSGDQRFFLAYAQSWRVKRRDERVLQLLATDPHAPGQFRSNGAAIHIDGFHAAFGTGPGDRMFTPAPERLHLW